MREPAPVAVALDAPDLETAARWAALVTPHVSTVKVGLELYLRYGPQVVATVRGASRMKVFLDLKLHDIPATVAGAARAGARVASDSARLAHHSSPRCQLVTSAGCAGTWASRSHDKRAERAAAGSQSPPRPDRSPRRRPARRTSRRPPTARFVSRS